MCQTNIIFNYIETVKKFIRRSSYSGCDVPIYRVFHKKTPPFIFGYNSHINGPICVKFAANVR